MNYPYYYDIGPGYVASRHVPTPSALRRTNTGVLRDGHLRKNAEVLPSPKYDNGNFHKIEYVISYLGED